MNKAPNDNPEPEKGTAQIGKPGSEHIESSLISSETPQHKRILVVDDSPDILFTLRVGLESDPTIQVYGYDNPVTALVEFTPNFYDLLLIDVNMPLMDGFQLAQNLVRRVSPCPLRSRRARPCGRPRTRPTPGSDCSGPSR